jgi:hypothetical protein
MRSAGMSISLRRRKWRATYVFQRGLLHGCLDTGAGQHGSLPEAVLVSRCGLESFGGCGGVAGSSGSHRMASVARGPRFGVMRPGPNLRFLRGVAGGRRCRRILRQLADEGRIVGESELFSTFMSLVCQT